MVGGDAELNAVVPDLPVISVEFQGLFGASERLLKFVLNSVAVCNISPSLNLSLIDGHDISKCENSFIYLFQVHVGTATSEPIVASQSIDFEGLVEAVDRFSVFMPVEVPSAE